MTDFQEFRDFAQDILSENGKTLNIVRYTDDAPLDTSKPWRVAGSTPTLYPVFGCIVDFKLGSRGNGGDIARKAILSSMGTDGVPLGITPTRDDLLLDSDGITTYQFDILNPLDFDGSGTIIYLARVTAWPLISSGQPTQFSAP